MSFITGCIEQIVRWFNNFHENRKARLRRELKKLRKYKKDIMKLPPTKNRTKKVIKLNKKIKEKEQYLESE